MAALLVSCIIIFYSSSDHFLSFLFFSAIIAGGDYCELWTIIATNSLFFIGLFPIMLFLYRKVINNLVDLGKEQSNSTAIGFVLGNSGGWWEDFPFQLSKTPIFGLLIVLILQITVLALALNHHMMRFKELLNIM